MRNFGIRRKQDPVESIRRANDVDVMLVLIGLAVAVGIILIASGAQL